MKTTETISQEEMTQHKKSMSSVLRTIMQGKIYAHVNKVSASGMTQYISFYRVYKGTIQNVTPQIAWLRGEAKIGTYKQASNWLIDYGLKVLGCGMDMIFHTLYSCLPYKQASKWSQRYNTL